MASRPGNPASRARSAASSGPRQPWLQRANGPSRARSDWGGAGLISGLIARSFRRPRFPVLGGMAKTTSAATSTSPPDISVVVPVFDEEGAAPDLAREIAAAFAGRNYEMLF